MGGSGRDRERSRGGRIDGMFPGRVSMMRADSMTEVRAGEIYLPLESSLGCEKCSPRVPYSVVPGRERERERERERQRETARGVKVHS